MQSYFPTGQIFFHPQITKYTAMSSEFSFPKKGKNKFNFRMVSLCTGFYVATGNYTF